MRNEDRCVSVFKDTNGKRIAVINTVIFKGKRAIQWDDVEQYIKRYIGQFYEIAEDNEVVFIGTELPQEYTGSVYTKKLKGAVAKAKANAAQAIPEMIEIAINGTYEENRKLKHSRDAGNGWYRSETRFAIPTFDDEKQTQKFNVFKAILLIRHAANGRKYLYDILEIKKETSISCQANALPGENPFLK